MAKAIGRTTNKIIGQSLILAETIAAELREALAREVSKNPRQRTEQEVVALAREILAQHEPILAEVLSGAEMLAWIHGYEGLVNRLPVTIWAQLAAAGGVPLTPSTTGGESWWREPPRIRFPLLDEAVASLKARPIVSPAMFRDLEAEAKRRAFTITADLGNDALDTVRAALAESIETGTSLRKFRKLVEERLGTSRIGAAHLENVYRTNIQTAFHEGQDALTRDPIVAAVFPYQEYFAVHDGRVRDQHLELETLGLNGTNVYRMDDPFWNLFTPPWDYQCRCKANPLTIEAAARRGVREAQEWLRTDKPPEKPEWRIDAIPFRPPTGFGGRGARIAA